MRTESSILFGLRICGAVVFGLIVLVTGPIWARKAWGVWWQWDPRQTSFLIVLLLQCGALALRAATQDARRRAAASAAYAVLSAVPALFLVFVFPRLPQIQAASFHPSRTVESGGFDANYWGAIAAMAPYLAGLARLSEVSAVAQLPNSGAPVQIVLKGTGPEVEAPATLPAVRLVGRDASGAERAVVVPLQADGDAFTARIAAPGLGNWRLEPAAGIDANQVDAGELAVVPPADEVRDPRADRAALDALAAAVGGSVHTDAATLIAALPRDAARIERLTEPQGLWDSFWAYAVLIALLAIDWALRRINSLP